MTSAKEIAALVLSAAVGGGVSAGVVLAVQGDNSPAASGQARAEGRDADRPKSGKRADLGSLERRVAQLERKQRAARALGGSRKAAGAKSGTSSGAAADTEGELVADAKDPVFESAVRDVVDQLEWERGEERRLKWEQRGQERLERETDYLAEKLDLTTAQKPRVEAILTARSDRFRELRRSDAGARPVTRREWRAARTKLNDEAEAELKKLLSDGQRSTYDELVEEEGSPFSRGGRGRGGRGR